MTKLIDLNLPKFVISISKTLNEAGFKAYIVGGCVRDMIQDIKPKDWDITTDATPEEILKLFEHTAYNNKFGTIMIIDDSQTDESLKNIEVTPFRSESGYSNKRHPDKISFGVSLEEDLKRRDFTINAIAIDPLTEEVIDYEGGIVDMSKKILRTVGNPDDRFNEDALRMMRAVRISSQLGFEIDKSTLDGIRNNKDNLKEISVERIRDEFQLLLLTNQPMVGIYLLYKTGLLKHIIPELEIGIGVEQNQAHKYDVFEHNLRTLEHANVKNLTLKLRMAGLIHDIAKPHTREWSKVKNDWTFHGHEVVGAKLAKTILARLKFPKKFSEDVRILVRWHMFFSDTEQISLAGVRRMLSRVGEEKMWELIDLRMCDRIGTGRPKEQPYRLRKYISMLEEVLRDPITPGILNLTGDEIMLEIKEEPGKRIGSIINILLSETIHDPLKNTKEYLLDRVKELSKLTDDELFKLGETGKIDVQKEDEKLIQSIRKKYGVK